ncbi:MAG TPA: S8 family serine peptidase [Myxococcota bacterium]|nr:S8 family serine peptidase [Myxococcota bacterium]
MVKPSAAILVAVVLLGTMGGAVVAGGEPAGSRVRLVQALGSARTILDDLERRGCRVMGYLPEDIYIVRLGTPGALDGMPGLRWQGAFRPEWKRAAGLARLDPGRACVLEVFALSGQSLDGLCAELAAFGKILSVGDDSSGTGHARLAIFAGYLASALDELTRLDEVAWVTPERNIVANNDEAAWVIQGGDSVSRSTPLFAHGLTGLGEVIGIADSGLDTDACQFRYGPDATQQTLYNNTQPPAVNVTNPDNKVISYYLFSGASAYDDMSKLGHGTHVSGCAAGDDYAHPASSTDAGRDTDDGMAPGARIVFQDTGRRDGNQVGLPDSLTDMYVQAYDSGARIHNDSFGKTDPDTDYTGDSRDVDEAAWRLQDLTIVFSSGNLGPNGATLDGIGATSKNTIVVGASLAGASNRGYGVCHFSSQGPTADGRLRPDLVAPGAIRSALETDWVAQGGTDIYGNPQADSTTDPPNNNCTTDASFRVGTSFAAPLVSGAAALTRQYFVEGWYPGGAPKGSDGFSPSAALVKAVLVNSTESIGPAPNSVPGPLYDVVQGEKIADMEAAPNDIEGWGVLRLDRSLYFSGDAERLAVLTDSWGDGADRGAAANPPIEESQLHTYWLQNVRAGSVLRVTLAWIDPAGTPGAGKALVNDLDLEVVDSSGRVFKGNIAFEQNRSTPAGSDQPDNINPLERVIISPDMTQNLELRVIGRHIPGNGRNSPYPSTRQGYALVAAGDFEGVCPAQGCPGTDGGSDAGDGFDGLDADAGQPDDGDATDLDAADGGQADPIGDPGTKSDDVGVNTKITGGCACSARAPTGRNCLMALMLLIWFAGRRRA